MNQYREMMKRHSAEIQAISAKFAFSVAKINEQLCALGLERSSTNEVCIVGDTGLFYVGSNAALYCETYARQHQELEDAISADKTGTGFIFQMLLAALIDHEYAFTEDCEEALTALGYSMADIEAEPRFKRALRKACAHIRKKQK